MGPPQTASDRDELRALQAGEANALDRIIVRLQRPLHEFAYQYLRNHSDAQDTVAEAFARLYKNRQRLRPDTVLSGWLFATLANLCCSLYRWQKRHPTVSLDAVPEAGSRTGGNLPGEAGLEPDRRLEKDEAMAALETALEELPHDLKVTLLLHHYNRMTYQEIAAVAHCSERGVETRLYRAKQKLRVALARYLHDGDAIATGRSRATAGSV